MRARVLLATAVPIMALVGVLSAQTPRSARTHPAATENAALNPEMRIVAGHISANSLRGHVSFLASDLLEGRDTPSRGLDIAAEYIASQFRRLGLEPVGDDDYFQSAPLERTRNVAGLLRGSDPALQDTYFILSAHYDHVGLAETGDDRVFNGANDDASGTASMLEIANALASLHPRPRRSILFIAFYGEEKGLHGSKFYAEHPLVPLAKTIGQLNLEQLGRTDAPERQQLDSANVTGFDYSDLTAALVDAGRRTGIAITKVPKASDAYFNRSDNGPLALAGIPAHTLSVTYDFPDYHAVGDEWRKLDYDNMAKVDQAVGIAVLRLAQSTATPHWNEFVPAVKRYADAARKLHEQ